MGSFFLTSPESDRRYVIILVFRISLKPVLKALSPCLPPPLLSCFKSYFSNFLNKCFDILANLSMTELGRLVCLFYNWRTEKTADIAANLIYSKTCLPCIYILNWNSNDFKCWVSNFIRSWSWRFFVECPILLLQSSLGNGAYLEPAFTKFWTITNIITSLSFWFCFSHWFALQIKGLVPIW